ncbi:hypothetical protein FB45DRAFT_894785 [Roridomyces roridus]|uniref:F-box domain-containing protein n=1 Tax=Roridomyces roridus TaxID=1738132 RepID=A0AAD7FX78_9AGAR|nr:hypothetical protein FB45DRAFT_894785 [Roridomyces roridus]
MASQSSAPNAASPSPETLTWVFENEPPFDPSDTPRKLLDSNDPPSDIHFPSLRDFLSRAMPRRARLDSKISVLKAALDKAVAERDWLDPEIRKHEGAVSSLRRIPTEILSSIFAFVGTGNLLDSEMAGPWSVSAVCSRWRAIALSTPSMWAEIDLDFDDGPDFNETDFEGRRQRLETHLERSGQMPLVIRFQALYEYMKGRDSNCDDPEEAALGILQTHCRRWETLEIVGPASFLYGLDTHGNLPLLRSLDVYITADDDFVGNAFKVCPNLRVATVNSGEYGDGSSFPLPYDQLLRYKTSLDVSDLPSLRLASHLVDCALHIHQYDEPLSPDTPRIQLPNLLRLSFSFAERVPVLDFFETPALLELYHCGKQPTALPSLQSMLKRLPKLQKLIVVETLSVDDVTELLRAAPTITEFGAFALIESAQQFLAALSSDSEATSSFPSLTCVSLGLEAPPDLDSQRNPPLLDQNSFMRMLESQLHVGRGWRKVNLYCMGLSTSRSMLDRKETLRAQGMNIALFSTFYSFCRAMIPDRYLDLCGDSWA